MHLFLANQPNPAVTITSSISDRVATRVRVETAVQGAFALENKLRDGIVCSVGIGRFDDVDSVRDQARHELRKIYMLLKDPMPKQRWLCSGAPLEKNNYLYHFNHPLRVPPFHAFECDKYIYYL